MSDLFRNLGGQGASSSRNNTQWWADYAQSDEGKALLAKQASGATLTPGEQTAISAIKGQQQKATKLGIEPSNTTSASTGVPDLTDAAAQSARMNQALMLVSGRGRRASMSNGEFGDSMLGGF